MIIVNNTNFNNIEKVNDEWMVLHEFQEVIINFENEMIRFASSPGFLFDGASIPKFIPFNNHLRWMEKMLLPAFVHDLCFIHKKKDYKWGARIMNHIMEIEGTSFRRPVFRAVNGLIAKRLFDKTNVTDYTNKQLSVVTFLSD
jgi:hypothetical protein